MGLSMSTMIRAFRLLLLSRALPALLCAVFAFEVSAARTIPANPTSNDEVIVVVRIVGDCEEALKNPSNRVKVEGFVISYVYASPCDNGLFFNFSDRLIEIQFPVGKLQAGTYTVEARVIFGGLNSVFAGDINQFVVSASDVNTPNPNAIPATHPLTIMMLGGLLVWIVHLRLLR
jgi:hypothetical protein